MGGFFTLLILSLVMAVASFFAGLLPLSFSLSRSQLRLISTIGMGVLVGTSLIVIIPEGVETLYKSNNVGHNRNERALQSGHHVVRMAHTSLPIRAVSSAAKEYSDYDPHEIHALDMPGPVIPDSLAVPPKTPTEPGVVGIMDTKGKNEKADETAHKHEDEDEEEAHHAWIGVALIFGFVLMFLIDKLPQCLSSPLPKPKTHQIALNHIGRRFNLSGNQDEEQEEHETFLENSQSTEIQKRGFATTIGLVIHAAADGIALGASSSTAQTGLSLVIFFAIMIHKGPAAFGLTTVLLRQGLSKRMVRAHLVLFSAAAPTGALLTWFAARILGSGQIDDAAGAKWWTGVLLIFSGGTFLYVAMHSMQEITGSSHDKHEMNGHANGSLGERRDSMDPTEEHKLSLKDLGAATFGMILPLFLQVGHAH